MKKLLVLFCALSLSNSLLYALDNGASFDFNDGDVSSWSSSSDLLDESSFSEAVLITSKGVGPNVKGSFFLFPDPLNLTNDQSISFKTRSKQIFSVRIDLIDVSGNSTTLNPVISDVKDRGEWNTIIMDFSGKFITSSNKTVNRSQIAGLSLFINPGSELFTGDILVDDLKIGSEALSLVGNGIPGIKLNQLGFYPESDKIAIVSSTNENEFSLVDELNNEVFTGSMGELEYWSMADDCVKVADFSDFKSKGIFKVKVENSPSSPFFEIKDQPYLDVSKAAIKAYYFNRASTELLPEFAGQFARASGHPDTKVFVHSSAADENRPTGTEISAPKGWYDAGDYNKYVVNSGISTYTLMSLYEHFPQIYDTLDLNIPESDNSVPDLLDEIKWNLDWMLAMQDPNDGGVYFKLTSKDFTGSILPGSDFTQRFVVKKSTSAALDFAAVMAVAYRVYQPYDHVFPGYAQKCLTQSEKAFDWAKQNPNIRYFNPSDINTGGYGDGYFGDEFSWAATELYIASGVDSYYSQISFGERNDIPNWNSVGALGFISLSHYLDDLTDVANKTAIKSRLSTYVSSFVNSSKNSAYKMPMGSVGTWEFNWGSNSFAANVSFLLLQNYYNSGDIENFIAAKANVDYLLGRNPLEYCFVTGYGSKSPQDPHHRPSEADGVVAPQPGFLVGGPNDNSAGESNCEYQYRLPALEYVDAQCSYSTNEIAINWNAPLSFILGAVNAESIGIKPSRKSFERGSLVSVQKKISSSNLSIFPNPVKNVLSISLKDNEPVQKMSLLHMNGSEVLSTSTAKTVLGLQNVKNGVYILQVETLDGLLNKKVVVQR